jgi:hypothetical protein
MFGVLEIVTRLNDKSNLHARFLVILKNKIKKIKIKFVILSSLIPYVFFKRYVSLHFDTLVFIFFIY